MKTRKLPATRTSDREMLRKSTRNTSSSPDHPQHPPWKTAAFWMTRNLSSMLADCRSCSMVRRAVAWYFSSIFLEQHVEPLGIHTCRSEPGEERRAQNLLEGLELVGDNKLHTSVSLQSLLGQIDAFSGIVLSKQLGRRSRLIRQSQDR